MGVQIHRNQHKLPLDPHRRRPAGRRFDWITALRSDTIRKPVDRKVVQPGLFDTYGLASVTSNDYPGERLLVCFNPLVAQERRRKCDVLLELT